MTAHSFEKQLSGGHPNSLGQTIAVVEAVLAEPEKFDALFHCYFSEDAVVRLRVSNAIKRIAKEKHALLLPYLDRFLSEISEIDQASTQWTLAQLFKLYESDLSPEQLHRAKQIIKRNLTHSDDWIVLNQSLDTLGHWAKADPELKDWLHPHLTRLSTDSRKSVAKKAGGILAKQYGG